MLLIAYPAFKFPFSLIDLKISNLLKNIIFPLISSFLMMGIVFIFKQILLYSYKEISLILMLSEVSLGIGSYFLLTVLLNKPVIEEIKIFYKNINNN